MAPHWPAAYTHLPRVIAFPVDLPTESVILRRKRPIGRSMGTWMVPRTRPQITPRSSWISTSDSQSVRSSFAAPIAFQDVALERKRHPLEPRKDRELARGEHLHERLREYHAPDANALGLGRGLPRGSWLSPSAW